MKNRSYAEKKEVGTLKIRDVQIRRCAENEEVL